MAPRDYGFKVIACGRGCGAEGTVVGNVAKWYCPDCRKVVRREVIARSESNAAHARCSIAPCDRAAVTRGMCRTDYQRWRRSQA